MKKIFLFGVMSLGFMVLASTIAQAKFGKDECENLNQDALFIREVDAHYRDLRKTIAKQTNKVVAIRASQEQFESKMKTATPKERAQLDRDLIFIKQALNKELVELKSLEKLQAEKLHRLFEISREYNVAIKAHPECKAPATQNYLIAIGSGQLDSGLAPTEAHTVTLKEADAELKQVTAVREQQLAKPKNKLITAVESK